MAGHPYFTRSKDPKDFFYDQCLSKGKEKVVENVENTNLTEITVNDLIIVEHNKLKHFASVVTVVARSLKVQVSSLAREIALRKLICIWLNLDWRYYFPVCGDPGKGSRVIVN
uniref:Uncharacterized protein n=1 Tax=Solanum tuberosum TaxID=4113 RepID=M1D983_SOLTU